MKIFLDCYGDCYGNCNMDIFDLISLLGTIIGMFILLLYIVAKL